jgi:hypothetical protein
MSLFRCLYSLCFGCVFVVVLCFDICNLKHFLKWNVDPHHKYITDIVSISKV